MVDLRNMLLFVINISHRMLQQKKQRGGSLVPTEPPSIFGDTQSSLIPQTTSRVLRSPELRNVTAEARTRRTSENIVDPDIVVNFADLANYCEKFSPYHYVDNTNPHSVKIFKLDDNFPPKVKYSLLVSDEFHVEAYRGNQKIVTRDIINRFHNTLQNFSHLDSILDRLGNTPTDIRSELRSCGKDVSRLADEIDDDPSKRRKLVFTGKQIMSLHKRSYSNDDMLQVIAP